MVRDPPGGIVPFSWDWSPSGPSGILLGAPASSQNRSVKLSWTADVLMSTMVVFHGPPSTICDKKRLGSAGAEGSAKRGTGKVADAMPTALELMAPCAG